MTPVTLETFNEWKKNRTAKKEAEELAARKAKETRMKAGRSQGMSGRDLFDFNPSLAMEAEEDEDAMDLTIYERNQDNDIDGGDEKDQQQQTITDGVANMSLEDGEKVTVKEELFAEENLDDLDDD